MSNSILTYNVGIFVTSKSDKELQEFVKDKRTDQIAYKTGMNREEAVAMVNRHPKEKAVIYCPQTDSYVDKYFRENFLNLDDPLGKLMFDENRTMLSRIDEGLCFKDGILLTDDGEIKRNVKFKLDEQRFIIGVEN